MRMYSSRRAPIVLVAVLSLMGRLVSAEPETRKLGRIKHVKLELEKAFISKKPTDITLADLKETYDEYKEWPESEKNALRSLPKYRLVIDFALTPMKLENPPSVSTIQETYNYVQDVYTLGRVLPTTMDWPKDFYANWLLFQKVVRRIRSAPVEEDFEAGKQEALGVLKRMDEIVEGGLIYQDPEYLIEFEKIVCFFNYALGKPFYIHVYPAMKAVNLPEQLELLYHEYRVLYGYSSDWKTIDKIYREPGFMKAY